MKIRLTDILRPAGKIERIPYFIWGLVLFGIKYYIDKLINLVLFERPWFITDYFIRADELILGGLSDDDKYFYMVMALTAIPFIWFGTVLCIKRLKSANLTPWLVLFFFLPFINFLLFLVLSAVPDHSEREAQKGESFLSRIIPKSKLGSAAYSISTTLILSLFLIMFTANHLESYGWGLFIGIPFFIGFGSVIFYSYHHEVSLKNSLGISFFAMFVFGLVMLGLAIEGFICIFMAFPIGLLIGWAGGLLAYSIQRDNDANTLSVFLMFLSLPLLSFIEKEVASTPNSFSVSTEVIIEAPIEKVWHEVIHFSEIDPPSEWMFLNGISYPIKARLEYEEDTVRYCVFNNGTFIEPITKWKEPVLLEFDVKEQPEPMRELSPYGEIDAPHLHGYFQTTQGQFKLKEENGKTILTGTTWYFNDVWPNFY